MKKLNSLLKKHGACIGALAICFMLLISMLCSATGLSYSAPYTLINPDNLPQELTIISTEYSEEKTLEFGSGTLTSYCKVNVTNGVLGFDNAVFSSTLPDGDYLMFGFLISQPSGYTSTVALANGFEATLSEDIVNIACYYTDSLDFVVTARDSDSEIYEIMLVFLSIPPSPTDSITSVWTSITNWVISSLNTVQGIFYGAGEEVFTPDTSSSDTVDYNGVTYYPIDLTFLESFDNGEMRFNGRIIDFADSEQSVSMINGVNYGIVSNLGDVIYIINLSNHDYYGPIGFELVGFSDGSLTLLGTLAVIGVSISLAFLLIGIIQRFLRLRG